ncbi:MAG: HDIG domain-containing protein [Candidatus Aenigmarchaeota archaeon]|nr:HDIG domain-containing protein [Candidatus Aenigmarchaeota archaeon]MCX8179181.1 HDIG domain-containing protein [Candidatus Aenigmarchaeota archaeon]
MEILLKLAEKIEDKELRKKVIDYINDKKLKNPKFSKYKREDLEKAGSYFSVGGSSFGPVERDVVHHTAVLTHMVVQVAKIVESGYGISLDIDALIAASICHDIMKSAEFNRDENNELEPTGISLDHTILGVAELYAREFPEEVIHIVASHPGEAGTTQPKSFEAVIFHQLDSLASVIEYYALVYSKLKEKMMEMSKKEKDK